MLVAVALGAAAALVGYLSRGDHASAGVHRAPTTLRHHAKAAQYLFANDAHRGTLVAAGKAGEYDLTLFDVHPSSLYFVDRPGNLQGSIPTSALVRHMFRSKDKAQPNAAVNALVDGHQRLMGVKLLSGSYSQASGTLRYHVLKLKQAPGKREHGLTDVTLPRSFGHTSVFIDGMGGGSDCYVQLNDWTDEDLTLADSEYSTPSYWPQQLGPNGMEYLTPPSTISSGFDGVWENQANVLRGCWTTMTYVSANQDFEVIVSVTDPESGPNTYTCTPATNTGIQWPFQCNVHQRGSELEGSNLMVYFDLCSVVTAAAETMGGATTTCDQIPP